MSDKAIASAIDHALVTAGLSQRQLADRTGISQPTVSRIISGARSAKLPELILIAQATGHTLTQLTGASSLPERVQQVARWTNGAAMQSMRTSLLNFLELDEYLDEQAVGVEN